MLLDFLPLFRKQSELTLIGFWQKLMGYLREYLFKKRILELLGRGNNVATPYDDRGEGITTTQKVGNFFKMLGTFPNKKLV
jgi:hypothetical protein